MPLLNITMSKRISKKFICRVTISFVINIFINIVNGTSLVDKAIEIANHEFDFSHNTVVMWKGEDTDCVTEFLMKYKGCIITAPIQSEINIFHDVYSTARTTQAVFLASTSEEFDIMATTIKAYVIVSLRAILIFTKTANNFELNITMKSAWENDIGDIVVIATENKDKEARLWTYMPYNNYGDCGNYTAVTFPNTCKGFFPRKFKNFQKCPVKVSLLDFIPYVVLEKENGSVTSVGGIDGTALALVIEKLNASMEVVSSTDHGGIGTYKSDGTATGSFGDLVNRIADILAPGIIPTDRRYLKSQPTYVYQTLDAYWCGPNRQEIYVWAKVLLPFYSSMTLYIFLSFVIFILFTKMIRKYSLCDPDTSKGIFFVSFVIFLGQEVKQLETKCWLVNSLFTLWIWSCMIVRIAYQGNLIDGFQKVILDPALTTFEEALKRLEGYGGEEVFSKFLPNSTEGQYEVLQLDDIPIYLKEISEGKPFLMLTDILLVEWYGQKMQILDEPLAEAPLCLHVRPSWSAASEVIQITYQIAEAGLIAKLQKGLRNVEWDEIQKEASSISMTTLGGLFYGLLAMYIVCAIIFSGEIIYYKYRLKHQTPN